jgi:hypothetical protein
MSKVGTKTVVGRVQPLPNHIKAQQNYVGSGTWGVTTLKVSPSAETAQERFARRMRRKDHLASGVLDVFGNHHKDCTHEERMIVEEFTNSRTTTDLCFGCGSTLTVEHRIPTIAGAPLLNAEETITIEEGYGKFYPSQLTKKIYRALLDLKEEGKSNLPCM